jgi:hypothetical protein
MIFVSGYRARRALAVAGPSISGICTSIRTRSGFKDSIAFRASDPDDASPTRRRSDADASIARAAVLGRMLSSTTSTLNTFRFASAFAMRAAYQDED